MIAILFLAVAIQLVRMRTVNAVPAAANALTSTAAKEPAAAVSVGSRITVDGVRWSEHPKSVVLLFWSTCPACNAHVAFYQQMSRQVRASGGRGLVAVAIEPLEAAAAWLETNHIEPTTLVRIDNPSAAGLLLVPTVLIVDSRGIVTNMWAGSVGEVEQKLFLDRLDQRSASDAPVSNVTPVKEIREIDLASMGTNPTILDTSRRSEVVQIRPGSLHIPSDELEIRAPRELPKSGTVVIDCRGRNVVTCRTAAWDLTGLGFRDLAILRSN